MAVGGPDDNDALNGFVDGLDHDTVLSTGFEDQADARTVLSAPDPALLAMTPAAQPAAPTPTPVPKKPIPKLLAATDVVPGFRAGVKLTRNAAGGYEIHDQTTGEAFSLNEYEGSLARMLNGQRPISDILEAGKRLGIPINLESLQKFIQQLDGNGFLGSPEEQEPRSAWASRGEWETSVRTLFQSGIRLLRQGKHAEAAGYFEALLEEDPGNVEARELLAMANLGPGAQPEQRPSEQHMSAVAAYAPVPYSGPPQMLVQQQPQPKSRFGLIAIIAITVLVIAGGIIASQVSSDKPKQQEAALPVPPPPPPVAVDAADVAQAIPVDAAPIPVDAPDVVPVKPENVKTTEVVKDKPPVVVKDKPPVVVRPPPPHVDAVKVEASLTGTVTAFLKAPRAVKKGDKLFEIVHLSGDPAAIRTATAKVADMEKMAKDDPGTYEAFLADARKELELARGATSSVVIAPRAGRATPHVKQGADVKQGQLLVTIE